MAWVYAYSSRFSDVWLYVGVTSRAPNLRHDEHWRYAHWYPRVDAYLYWHVEERLKFAVERLLVRDLPNTTSGGSRRSG